MQKEPRVGGLTRLTRTGPAPLPSNYHPRDRPGLRDRPREVCVLAKSLELLEYEFPVFLGRMPRLTNSPTVGVGSSIT